MLGRVEKDDPDFARLKIEGKCGQAVSAGQQLAIAHGGGAADVGNPVPGADDPADLAAADLPADTAEVIAQLSTSLQRAVKHERAPPKYPGELVRASQPT